MSARRPPDPFFRFWGTPDPNIFGRVRYGRVLWLLDDDPRPIEVRRPSFESWLLHWTLWPRHVQH